MGFADKSSLQIITDTDLNGYANGSGAQFTALTTIPTNNRALTKSQAAAYVDLITTVSTYSSKSSGQLVAKRDLIPKIRATATGANVSCNGGSNGSITVTGISGGAGGPYQTKNGVGGTYTTWTTSTVYSSLSAGSYTIYVKDSSSYENTFAVTITQPAALSFTTSQTSSSITVSTSGGTGARTYQLYRDTASPYQVGDGSVIATNSGVAVNTNSTFSGLSAGYYWVRATDANGCTLNTTLFTL